MPPRARVLRAALLAGACAVVLAARTYVDFAPVRARVVRTPVDATGGIVQLPVRDARVIGLRLPFALIARIRNDAAGPERFTFHVDNAFVCDAAVERGAVGRIDCAVRGRWDPPGVHSVTVRGPSGPWALEYLELATHHGASAGILPFVILPGESRLFGRVPAGWIVAAWLALAAALALPWTPWRRPRALSWLYRGIVGVFVVCLVLVLLAPVVTKYLIVLDARSLVGWFGLLLAPALWQAGRRGFAALENVHAAWAWTAACVLVGALGGATVGAVMQGRLHEEYRGNYSGFLHLARRYIDANPVLRDRDDIRRSLVIEDTNGYDAQFMYAAIYDPLATRHDPAAYGAYIDAPPYRYGRIGFSLLTKVLSVDRWPLYPAVMVWSIIAGTAVCGFVLARVAHAAGTSPAWGGLVVLVPGIWRSLQTALPEPVAIAVLLCGYLCALGRRWTAAGLLIGFSLLIRETGAIFLVCLAASVYLSGERRAALRFVLLAVAPLALWRLYVGSVFWPEWGVAAFWSAPDDFAVPVRGMAEMWMAMARGEYWPDMPLLQRAAVGFSLVVTAGCALAVALAVRRPGVVTGAAAAYGLLTITFNYGAVWVHVGGAERLTQELFMMLALASATCRDCPRTLRVCLGVFWIAAGAYVLFGTYDAVMIRRALQVTVW